MNIKEIMLSLSDNLKILNSEIMNKCYNIVEDTIYECYEDIIEDMGKDLNNCDLGIGDVEYNYGIIDEKISKKIKDYIESFDDTECRVFIIGLYYNNINIKKSYIDYDNINKYTYKNIGFTTMYDICFSILKKENLFIS